MTNHAGLVTSSPVFGETLEGLSSSLSEQLATEVNRMHTDWTRLLQPVVSELATTASEQIAAAMTPFADQLSKYVDQILADALKSATSPGFRAAIDTVTRGIAQQMAVIDASTNASHRAVLYQLASEHHGFVTTPMAELAGVPSVELRKVAARGGMSNVARGLYRVEGIDSGERAPYAEAVFRVGEDAHLVGESVLAFHDLALVNPRRITVGTPRRVRRDLPAHIKLVHVRKDRDDLTEYDGVPSVTVERAIKDSIGSVMPERLTEAIHRATDEGLLRRRAANALLAELAMAA